MASRGRRTGIHCCPLIFLLRLLCRGVIGIARLSLAQPAGGMLPSQPGGRLAAHRAGQGGTSGMHQLSESDSHALKPG